MWLGQETGHNGRGVGAVMRPTITGVVNSGLLADGQIKMHHL
jgi:hypothetical protein